MLNTTICIYVFCVFYCNLIVQSSQALKPFVTKTRFVSEIERSTICRRLDKFGSFFYYATGCVYVPADGAEKGECTLTTRFSRRSGCTRSRLDTTVSRRSLTAIDVRRLPFNMASPSIKKVRSFGSIFVLAPFTGRLRVSLVFVYNCISSQYFCKNLCLNLSKTLDLRLSLH